MNNQPDPGVEAALERAKKLLARDPQFRRETWIKLLISLCLLVPFFILIFAFDKIFDNSTSDSSGINGFLAIAFYSGLGLGIYAFVLLDMINNTFKENKILKAISREFMKLKIEAVANSEHFSERELKTLNNINRTRIITIVSSWGTFVLMSITIGLLIYLFCFLTSIQVEFSPNLRPGITQWIYLSITGIITGSIYYIILITFMKCIANLWKAKANIYYEQLLIKLRNINTGDNGIVSS